MACLPFSHPSILFLNRAPRALYFSKNSSKVQILLLTPLILVLSNFFYSKPSTSNSVTHPTPPPHNLLTTSSVISLIQILHYTLSSPLAGFSPFFPAAQFLYCAFPNTASTIKLSYPLSTSCCPPTSCFI